MPVLPQQEETLGQRGPLKASVSSQVGLILILGVQVSTE